MKKEKLLELGLTEELAENVAKESAEELKGFVPLERLSEVTEAKKRLEADLAERDGQLESLRKSKGDIEALRQQITTLQTENADNKAKYEADMKALKMENAVKSALTAAQARNAAVVTPLLAEFLKTAEIDDNGTIKGLDKEIEKLKKDENSSFLFNVEQPNEPKLKGFEPATGAQQQTETSNGALYAQKYNSQFMTQKE